MKLFNHKNSPQIVPRELEGISQLKMLNLLIIFVIIFSAGTTFWFVYTRIYQTIGRVQTLLLIDQKAQFEPINFKLYNETTAAWNEKYDRLPPDITRNPFKRVEIITPTSTSSTVSSTINIEVSP